MRSESHDHHHPDLSIFIIGTIPILFAAVQPWVWSIYCLLMIAAVILQLWTMGDQSPVPPGPDPLKITVPFFSSLRLFCAYRFPIRQ
jgi:hypothetical protein